MDQTTIQVPHELFASAESSSFSGTYSPDSIEAGPDLYAFDAPLSYNVVVTNTGGALLVAGTVTGAGKTACARCLEDVQVDIAGEVEGYFLIDAADGADEGADDDAAADDFDVLGPDETIDLAPLLDAAILVDLPLQPLCREDCRGICPDCGVNLNDQDCSCAKARAEQRAAFEKEKNPFSVLEQMTFNDADE